MAMFRSRFGCQLAILTLLFATADAQASGKPSEAELAAITARGVLLAEYDTAAWQATDAVQAAHAVKERVGRYIGRKTDAGWVVDFGRLNQAQDRFLVAYEAVQLSAKFEVKSFDPAREDTGWNLAAAKGIETAMRDFGATSRPYNIAVLPADHESLYVYLYPAQVTAGVYPLGADVRYHVSPDGTFSLHVEKFAAATSGDSSSVSFQSHIDRGNPNRDVVGLFTHALVDGFRGALFHHNDPGLDPQ